MTLKTACKYLNKLCTVKWIDAADYSGKSVAEAADGGFSVKVTMGMIVRVDKFNPGYPGLLISTEFVEGEDYHDLTIVPLSWVVKIKEFRK